MKGNKGNTSGNRTGEKGTMGDGPRSLDDEVLAARRFEEYVKQTRNLEPFSYDFEDILPLLPTNGATVMACGETRFDHVMYETCSDPKASQARCGNEMTEGRFCYRVLGHPNQCMSKEYSERQKKHARQRRARERTALDERNS